MNDTSLDDLVSVREAAALLRVSESTLWRWIKAGDVPWVRVGPKRVFVKRSDLASRLHPNHRGGEPGTSTVEASQQATLARAANLVRRVRALHERQRATPGWGKAREAWEDINEMRDERACQLDPSR